jgi:hypothetical protein
MRTAPHVQNTPRRHPSRRDAKRPGHVCGTFTRPCIHHKSMHCLACCVAARAARDLDQLAAILAEVRKPAEAYAARRVAADLRAVR